MRAIPQHEKLQASDVVVPLDSWHELYNRIMLLTAMASGSHIAICGTSGGGGYDLDLLKRVDPTVIIA